MGHLPLAAWEVRVAYGSPVCMYSTSSTRSTGSYRVFGVLARGPNKTACEVRISARMSFHEHASICAIVLLLRQPQGSVLEVKKIPPRSRFVGGFRFALRG